MGKGINGEDLGKGYYQKANGLSADGIVGPNTWKKLLGL